MSTVHTYWNKADMNDEQQEVSQMAKAVGF